MLTSVYCLGRCKSKNKYSYGYYLRFQSKCEAIVVKCSSPNVVKFGVEGRLGASHTRPFVQSDGWSGALIMG